MDALQRVKQYIAARDRGRFIGLSEEIHGANAGTEYGGVLTLPDLKQVVAEVDSLIASLTLSRAEGRREGMEEAAFIAADRLMTMGYPLRAADIAAAIREAAQGKEGE